MMRIELGISNRNSDNIIVNIYDYCSYTSTMALNVQFEIKKGDILTRTKIEQHREDDISWNSIRKEYLDTSQISILIKRGIEKSDFDSILYASQGLLDKVEVLK